MQSRVTRADVLDLIRRRFEVEVFSTIDIADGLGCEEYRVRGALAWLVAGGVIRTAGTTERRDRSNVRYPAKLYRWSGRSEIRRVPQDREARHLIASPAPTANEWLSRAWT
ncbi:hypothetical protein [Thiocapsa sp. UBA6158]|jgi:predicted ArsR family transcriptional regulator|uniref:hypothetical protein n=1 Tax=Thiocapsa sp. UBA6158 TaxID=1947692 RepID=UPI0025D973C2|nr:hypothetical protein [Thiocapsa sp. UBA6158]